MAKKKMNPNSLKNLVQFNSENARPAQRKSACKRSENVATQALIDQNLDTLLRILFNPMTREEFENAVATLPNQFLRIYGHDLQNQATARIVIEKIIDRVKGLPHQSADVSVNAEVSFAFKFGDQ